MDAGEVVIEAITHTEFGPGSQEIISKRTEKQAITDGKKGSFNVF